MKQPVGPCRQLFSPAGYFQCVTKHKGKSRSRLAVINVDENIVLGTLGNGAAITSDGDPMGREFYWISNDLYWQVDGLTVGQGPIVVGIAHNDYTDVEIAENLNQTGMEDPGDKIAQEHGRRLVRRSGQFGGGSANEALNDGKSIRTKAGWVLQDGFAPAFWAQNKSGAALTTGAAVRVLGKMYGRWV